MLNVDTSLSISWQITEGRDVPMFRELFDSMNQVLDEIMIEYSTATDDKKRELNEQVKALKEISNTFIEEWLQFEEKMDNFNEVHLDLPKPSLSITPKKESSFIQEINSDYFQKGLGYFKLLMYHQAVEYFNKTVIENPEFLLTRVFLALSYLEIGEKNEAYNHFQFLTSVSENDKINAISYNAMGCIQMFRKNVEKAEEYFNMAKKIDPALSFYSLS
ncbi:tetratricopeptide repeat protein [Chengkuizengella sp. SCS-71B]|uniref:tetratricopeptide repeat protein n=1 Tax=Chengkuizengella sp. SCS-71B TaxID=3115290 RepID=UPI0032C245A2